MGRTKNLLVPLAFRAEELALRTMELLLPLELASFPMAIELVPFEVAFSPIEIDDAPCALESFPMLIDWVPIGPNGPVTPDPLPIAMESVLCSVPAFRPIDIPPVALEELAAPVPIAIGSEYTTPVATICQSVYVPDPPNDATVIDRLLVMNMEMLPVMNLVGSDVENARTVWPTANAVFEDDTLTVKVLEPVPIVFDVLLVSGV